MMDDSAYLPMDIMVMILSRLPVKSLLRFKAVCKSWNALIASPPFMRSHLLNFNTSKSHTLFINAYFRTVTFVRYQDRKFQMDEAVYELPEGFETILCSCNGVLLLRGSQHEVFLWNPSIRKMDRLYLPFKLDQFVTLGLCYNPVIADLRIVAASWERYAIFSCNNRSWKKGKVGGRLGPKGCRVSDTVCVDGAVYWVSGRWHDVGVSNHTGDIVCFESEGDVFKTLQKPNYLKPMDVYNLICLRDRLCVWFSSIREAVVRIWMKKEDNIWMEFMKIENIPYRFKWDRPLYVEENEIIVRLESSRVLLYRPCEKTCEDAEFPGDSHLMVHCVDSLFFFSTARRNRKRSIHLQ